ncbi:hypothetical protein [Klebsiella pneumoniae]|uniref:hypothetical protein n=1 Tax=Klebsiella pneumoniae TaxID=573 RepID=UPI0037C14865
MKKIIASGVPLLLAGGYCASLSAACQMVSGKTIEYSVNVSQASINLDVSDLPIGSLLYSYGGMIITNAGDGDRFCPRQPVRLCRWLFSQQRH